MRVRGRKLSVTCQNEFYTQPGLYVPGDVCTISARYVLDIETCASWADYYGKTQSDVENELRTVFLVEHPLNTSTRGTMIIDMEGTAYGHSSHPNNLHLETDADKALVITAWKRRFAAVRAVFPYSRIGVYATPRPDAQGRTDDATYLARIAALVQAGTTTGYSSVGSAWDGIDMTVPIIYTRYGPNDDPDEWESQAAMATQGVTGAASILKSNGSSMPRMALLSTYDAGSTSTDFEIGILDLDTEDPLGDTWGAYFDVFKSYGVEEVAVWNGLNSRYARDGNGESTHLLSTMIHAGRGWG